MSRFKNAIRIFAGILVAFLLIAFITPAIKSFAYDKLWDSNTIPATRVKPRVVDNANLLSDSEEKELIELLEKVSKEHKTSLAILTVEDHDGTIRDFADDYFDYNGFCSEYDESGAVFVISMADREWYLSTSGSAVKAITDYGRDKLSEKMMPDLKDGDYAAAFKTYANRVDEYFDMYEMGKPFDVGSKTNSELLKYFIISVLAALVVALIPVFCMVASLNNVHAKQSASDYHAGGGVNLRVHEDRFITSHVTKTAIPQSDSRSSGGGGGSSVHISSSGHSHGGGGGHF